MLFKNNKNASKTKAISSYILSGINIKRMIQDQFNSECNVSQINIIRVNKRPIFKIKEKEKENSVSVISSLPNKSFKIRSYTKKMKDGGKDDDSSEIFEKVEKLRNYRVNSNRIEIFNLSRQNRIDKDQKETKIQSKIKEILQREASIKCKVSNQVFVKEVAHKASKIPLANFQSFDTEKYREIAHKINVYFNPHCQQIANRNTLLIVSLQSLHMNSKRMIKSSSTSYEEAYHSKPQRQTLVTHEQAELLKMLSGKYYPKDANWSQLKIAFKVNNSQQLQQLKNVLQCHQINEYYCIFYPIKKYVQCWNLYQIDCLLENTTAMVLLETKHRIKEQFPIISSKIKSLFIQTNNDNFVTLSRTISAVKYFISEHGKISLPQCQNILIALQEDENIDKKDENEANIQSNRPCIAQFNLKQQIIEVNTGELNAKVDFVLNSRQLKHCNMRHHNRSAFTEKDIKGKRRTLCQRETNIPLPNFKNRNFYNSSASATANAEDKWEVDYCKQENLDNMRQNLLFNLKNERNIDPISLTKANRRVQMSDKSDQIDEITNTVRGGCKSKTNHQIISQLIKRNTNIFKQIQEFVHKVSFLNLQPKENNNISVSNFNEKQYTKSDLASQNSLIQDHTDPKLHILAYKIF